MRTLVRAALSTALVGLVASCGVAGPPKSHVQEQESRDCSRGTFDFGTSSEAQPLGSSKALYQKMLEAQENKQTIPVLDITHAAGWSDEWDRMVDVGEHTNQAELNSRAQTPGYCWKGLPPTSAMSDRPSDGYYLFVRDNKPVQFIQYRPSMYPILMLTGVVVTKESVLTYYGSKLKPQ